MHQHHSPSLSRRGAMGICLGTVAGAYCQTSRAHTPATTPILQVDGFVRNQLGSFQVNPKTGRTSLVAAHQKTASNEPAQTRSMRQLKLATSSKASLVQQYRDDEWTVVLVPRHGIHRTVATQGTVSEAVFSDDGRTFAFVEFDEDVSRVVVCASSGYRRRVVFEDKNVFLQGLAWAGDNHSLAAVAFDWDEEHSVAQHDSYRVELLSVDGTRQQLLSGSGWLGHISWA